MRYVVAVNSARVLGVPGTRGGDNHVVTQQNTIQRKVNMIIAQCKDIQGKFALSSVTKGNK